MNERHEDADGVMVDAAPGYCDPATGKPYLRDADPVRAALRDLVSVLREYGTFPPKVLPALRAAEGLLAVNGVVGATNGVAILPGGQSNG